MRSSVQAGGRHLITAGVMLSLLASGCPSPNPSSTPTPPPQSTPIIVAGQTPEQSATPSPRVMVDRKAEREESLREVAALIERAREEFPGRTGIVFVDIESDKVLDYDGSRQFESASLMKLVVIAELYRLIQVGELDIDYPLTLEQKHIVGGAGDLKNLEPGTTFSIKVLVEKMITQSDNTATQMLTDFLTKDALQKSIKNLGLTGTTINRDVYDFAAIDEGLDNYITAKDAARLLVQIAKEELPGSKEIHSVLERQQRNDMIGHNFPSGTRVAHKTGELNGILHDVGIVYAPRGAFVVALLSDQVQNRDKGVEIFGRLAYDILRVYQTNSPTPSSSPSEEASPAGSS